MLESLDTRGQETRLPVFDELMCLLVCLIVGEKGNQLAEAADKFDIQSEKKEERKQQTRESKFDFQPINQNNKPTFHRKHQQQRQTKHQSATKLGH